MLPAGGVGGLVTQVLGGTLAGVGLRAAYAEGNALGKGPVVLHIPRCAPAQLWPHAPCSATPHWSTDAQAVDPSPWLGLFYELT